MRPCSPWLASRFADIRTGWPDRLDKSRYDGRSVAVAGLDRHNRPSAPHARCRRASPASRSIVARVFKRLGEHGVDLRLSTSSSARAAAPARTPIVRQGVDVELLAPHLRAALDINRALEGRTLQAVAAETAPGRPSPATLLLTPEGSDPLCRCARRTPDGPRTRHSPRPARQARDARYRRGPPDRRPDAPVPDRGPAAADLRARRGRWRRLAGLDRGLRSASHELLALRPPRAPSTGGASSSCSPNGRRRATSGPISPAASASPAPRPRSPSRWPMASPQPKSPNGAALRSTPCAIR